MVATADRDPQMQKKLNHTCTFMLNIYFTFLNGVVFYFTFRLNTASINEFKVMSHKIGIVLFCF